MGTNITTATYEGILTRGTQSAIDNTSIEDGKVRVAIDTKRLFLDFDSNRIEISDLNLEYTHSQLKNKSGITNPISNKIYIASDTKHVFVYNASTGLFVDVTNFTVDNAVHATTADYAVNAAMAINASTSEYAVNASSSTYATNAATSDYATNANNASTATYAVNAGTSTYATNAGSASSATNATNASTATYAVNAGTSTYATNASTADYAASAAGSISAGTATYAVNAGTSTYATNASTANYATNAGSATNASTANYATNAGSAASATNATNASTANYATNAGSASSATNASTADYAKNANNANNATNASTATYATNAGSATSATSATNASTANYATNSGTVNGKTVGTNVPADAKFTDTTYSNATTATAGLMSSADKTKLNGIAEGATANIGTVTSVKVGTESHNPTNGVVSLPAYPTTLPASDVSAWAKAASKPTYTASEVGAIASTAKGAASGVAELDSSGKVPSSQLPSFVDDVLEYANKSSFPTTGESGKIYVDKATNLTYRWSGTAYVEISPSLALGETDSTAYRGDRGKIAYDHSQSTHARTDATAVAASSTNGNIKINGTETTVYTHPGSGTNPHGTTKSDVGLGNVGNFKAVSTVANQGLTDTEKANARSNIGAGSSSFSGNYNDLSNKPTIPAAANNGTLTIQKNGTKVQTFTANQSTNVTANITVPTKTSELTNDSGFKTTDNNTTYTLAVGTGTNANKIVLTPSSGTANTITVPYATNASTATYASSAGSASSATNATNATNASTANYAKSAGSATSATSATNASTATYAKSAGSATSATSATNASTATYATSAGSAGSATNATNASTANYAKSAPHPTITQSTNTTSNTTATYGGTFTVIDSITKDSNGHVTKYNTKTVKMPAYFYDGMDMDFGELS